MNWRKAGLTAAFVAAGLAVIAGGAFLWIRFAPRRVPPGQAPLVTLENGSLPLFREAFNAGTGKVRVLALLSPT